MSTKEPNVTGYHSYVGINEAARIAHKGKTQIYRDIDAGKLSWHDDGTTTKKLQVSDLDRVYALKISPVTSAEPMEPIPAEPSVTVSVDTLALALLKRDLAHKEEIIRRLEGQLTDVWRVHNAMVENQRLLPPAPAKAEPEPIVQHKSWWERIRGKQ